jgi:glycosyltransferase involved in cell wall biosynthesis
MRIAHITAGAGHMYCGSCLRDNVLAAALLDAGHDVVLIPTYTPTRPEGRNVSLHRVFMGGINVFLQEHLPFFRRTPRFLNRLLDAAPLLRLATSRGISVDPHQLGRLTVSMLRGADGAQHRPVLELIRFLADDLSPEVVNIPNSLLIALAPAIKRELGVPVVCTLQGEDGFLEDLGQPYREDALRLIREHAAAVDAFAAVSEYGADKMSEYLGIERSRVHVVPVGIDFDGHARAGLDGEPFTIGYLARIAPEKGLHVLCEVYRRLRATPGCPPTRLLVAGYLAPEHKSYLEGIRGQMEAWGLGGHLDYRGELDRAHKLAFLQGLSVLSVPSPKPTQKGQFVLEAMASGVPVVQPRLGAYPEVVESTGGGILTEPGDLDGLAIALLALAESVERRKQLGAAAYDGVRARYGVPQMVARVMQLYGSLVSLPRGAGPEARSADLRQE